MVTISASPVPLVEIPVEESLHKLSVPPALVVPLGVPPDPHPLPTTPRPAVHASVLTCTSSSVVILDEGYIQTSRIVRIE